MLNPVPKSIHFFGLSKFWGTLCVEASNRRGQKVSSQSSLYCHVFKVHTSTGNEIIRVTKATEKQIKNYSTQVVFKQIQCFWSVSENRVNNNNRK